MNSVTTGLLEDIAKDIACAELPIVRKWIQTLEKKVPEIGLRHLALAEIDSLLGDIETDLDCPAPSASTTTN